MKRANKYGARKSPCKQGHTPDSGRGGIRVPRSVKNGASIALLPWPPIREYLEFFYSEGRTTAEIADLYGCKEVTIRQHRKRLGIEPQRATLAERLERFSVLRPSGCIEWIGAQKERGYGVISCSLPNHHRSAGAHRVSWELANNASLLPGAVIMHECDNPSCINPEHLTLGTHLENAQQAKARGRLVRARGERSSRALLSAEKVLEGRRRYAAGESIPRLSREFGVKYPALYNAVVGRTWAWL